MEKYAVELDPKKVEKAQKEKTAAGNVSSSTSNIPLDPEQGSLPFEKEPAEEKKE